MTEHGASAYFKHHPSLLPVVGAPPGFYTAEPLAQNRVELAAYVLKLPTIDDLVKDTSLTTGAGTFFEDYKAKIRRDKQNVEKTDYDLNLAIHGERVAAAQAALEVRTEAKFAVKASAPFGQFDTPRKDEERRSVVGCVVVRNPLTGYFADALVVEGSSGLDDAASHGLLFSEKRRVAVDLVIIPPDFDPYLTDPTIYDRHPKTGRPNYLNVKKEDLMRLEHRIVYDGYLAAVIAGGPGALTDPALRARYAVYEQVKRAEPARLARRPKEREEWLAKEYKDWVVRPRVA